MEIIHNSESENNSNQLSLTINDNSSCNSLELNQCDNSDLSKLSKKQMKRIERNKKWIEGRKERRKNEKEKRKKKIAQLKESGQFQTKSDKIAKLVPMEKSRNRVSIVIDCDFQNQMNDNEMKKLVKQINRCYSINKHSEAPCQLYITSIRGLIKDKFIKCQPGYVNWDAHCLECDWKEMFSDKNKVIYLSSESENVLPEPKEISDSSKIFIIGGLVDHNRHKGLCHQMAQVSGFAHARLPIDEHIKMTQRRVLAVNHGMNFHLFVNFVYLFLFLVFEIMLLASNGLAWADAFVKVIPQRKLEKNNSDSD